MDKVNCLIVTPHLLRDQAQILRNRAAVVRKDARTDLSRCAQDIIGAAADDLLRQAQANEREAAELEAALTADAQVQRYG